MLVRVTLVDRIRNVLAWMIVSVRLFLFVMLAAAEALTL